MTGTGAAKKAEISPEYYLWSFPGCPVRVRLKLGLVAQIADETLRDAEGKNGSRPERCGLLLGSGGHDAVEISGFVPVSREDAGDVPFGLAAGDLKRMADALARNKDNDRRVIGYYRSDFGEELRLRADETEIVSELFTDPRDIVLLVQGGSRDSQLGGIFFWDSGAFFADACFMPFPFDEQLLRNQEQTRVKRASEESARLAAVAEAAAADPAPVRPRNSRQIVLAGAVIGLLACAAGATMWYLRSPKPEVKVAAPAEAPRPSLALQANRSAAEITIGWDNSAPAITDARVGVMTVSEGGRSREIPLGHDALQTGKLVFTPTAESVQVSLEVFGRNGHNSRETLIILMNGATQAVAPPPRTRSVDVEQVEQEVQARHRSDVRSFTPPAASIPKPTVELAPTLERTAPATQPDVLANLTASVAKAPVPTGISQSGFAGSAPVGTPRTQAGQPGALKQQTTLVVQGPVPLKQVKPQLPPNVRELVRSETAVQVRVEIDATGKVVRATPVGGASGLLEIEAAKAAQRWTFQPAKRNGVDTAGEMVLTFTFVPEKR